MDGDACMVLKSGHSRCAAAIATKSSGSVRGAAGSAVVGVCGGTTVAAVVGKGLEPLLAWSAAADKLAPFG